MNKIIMDTETGRAVLICPACKKEMDKEVADTFGICLNCHNEEDAKAKAETADFEIEHMKASILADLHTLQGMIGNEAAKAWLDSEFNNLPF